MVIPISATDHRAICIQATIDPMSIGYHTSALISQSSVEGNKREILADADSITLGEDMAKVVLCRMDEGRKRVIGIMAAILASLHMQTADDLFGTPQGSPRTDKLIAASVQWAEQIMKKIDAVCGRAE